MLFALGLGGYDMLDWLAHGGRLEAVHIVGPPHRKYCSAELSQLMCGLCSKYVRTCLFFFAKLVRF